MRSRRLVWALPAIVLLLVAAQKEIRLMDGATLEPLNLTG